MLLHHFVHFKIKFYNDTNREYKFLVIIALIAAKHHSNKLEEGKENIKSAFFLMVCTLFFSK